MKKALSILVCCIALLQGCSKKDNNSLLPEETVKDLNLPLQSQKFGEAVATEIRGMVTKLNTTGYNFANVKNDGIGKRDFFTAAHSASPTAIRLKSANPNFESDLLEQDERRRNLTDVQVRFVNRIIDECSGNKSLKDLEKIISGINDDIKSSVPQIQQERLFNVTAVLYYGLREIEILAKKGLFVQKQYSSSSLKMPKLKSGVEDADGGTVVVGGAVCRKFLATVWTIAIGEPTPAGEIVAGVITVIVGGYLLYEVITCPRTGTAPSNPNDPYEAYCKARYLSCTSVILNGCNICYHYCKNNYGIWPSYSTHKCN